MDRWFSMMGAWPLLGSMAGAFVPILVVIYVVARWRGYREGASDPQLGPKLAFSVFRWLGLQLLLAGAAIAGYGLLGAGDDRGTALRVAAAVLVPALLVAGANEVAYRRTNHREQPMVGRMFAGVSLVQTGLIATLALVVACQVSFAREVDGDAARTAWSVAVVYGVAWLAQARALAASQPPR
jgi:hypothetical protein